MKKIKVLSIFGTRPEATKMVSPVKALQAHEKIESIVCVSAQHRELLDKVLTGFNIVPDYDLDLMKHGQSLAELTSRALVGIEDVIKKAQPDWILVHGDTTTTLAASLAAFYNKVQIGHVEAGLRTYDKYQPFPEEINRKVAGVVADLHFAPTELAKLRLLKESIPAESIIVTGNTGIDLMSHTVREDYEFENKEIASLDFNRRIILMTAHRRENWGKPHENIFKATRKIAEDFPDVQIVYPVHPNPIVKKPAEKILGDKVMLVDPINVFDMHNLMSRCYLVMSDSGGLQEEAPALNKPVVVLREVTERPEGQMAGTLVLAGTDEKRIYDTVNMLLTDGAKYKKMAETANPFGDGEASSRIVEEIIRRSKITQKI